MSTDYDYLFKLLIVGDSGVGKSCILLQYVDDIFMDSYISTIGVDFKIKNVQFKDNLIKLQIWDTAGQERFRTITSSYYRGADGIIIVYDITNRESFHNVTKWINEINRYAVDNVVKLLVGNKCDAKTKRVVEYEEGKELSEQLKIPFIEISAKNDSSVNETFEIIINEIQKKVNDGAMINIKPINKILKSKKVEDNNCECQT